LPNNFDGGTSEVSNVLFYVLCEHILSFGVCV